MVARRHRGGIGLLQRVVEPHDLEPLAPGLVDHRLEPADALVPPVAEQLGVERADRQPAARDPLPRTGHEVRGVAARLCLGPRRVVHGAVVRPRLVVVVGAVVVVAVGPVRRVAGVAPDELDRLAVDGHQQRARL